MERFMGLDVGDRTIGVALSDLLMITAQGLTTIKRTNLKADIQELRKITIGIQAEKVISFTEKLKEKINLPMDFQDERLTTALSEKILISADVKRNKRKEVIDKLAAVQILTTYMERAKRMM